MKFAVFSVVSVAALALGAQAHAQTMHPGYEFKLSGTVTGVDTLGLFGTAGASLNGKTFSEIFFVDTTKGHMTTTSTSQDDKGGTSTGYSDPVTAEISINGSPWLYYGSGSAGYYGDASVSTSSGKVSAEVVNVTAKRTVDLTFSFDGDTASKLGQSALMKSPTGTNTFKVFENGCVVEDLQLSTAVFSAPEPSTWTLMLGGVAALGLMMRFGGQGTGSSSALRRE